MKRSLTIEEFSKFSKFSEIVQLGLKVKMGGRTWTVISMDGNRIVLEN